MTVKTNTGVKYNKIELGEFNDKGVAQIPVSSYQEYTKAMKPDWKKGHETEVFRHIHNYCATATKAVAGDIADHLAKTGDDSCKAVFNINPGTKMTVTSYRMRKSALPGTKDKIGASVARMQIGGLKPAMRGPLADLASTIEKKLG